METTNQEREELDQQTSNLNRRIQSLEAQLVDAQELLQEETRQKLAAQSQARSFQSDLANLKEQREELTEQQLRYENDLVVLRAQLADQKRNAQEEAEQLLDEQKRRHQKDLENLQKEVEDAVLGKDRAERARRKLQEEVSLNN